MDASSMIAALDYNYHVRRQYKEREGSVDCDAYSKYMYHRKYNPRTKRECAAPVKYAKTYPYAKPIMDIVVFFTKNPSRIPSKYAESLFKPSKIAKTIHGCPSAETSTLVNQHISRFKLDDDL